jgi:hypothetical protein
MGEPLHEEKRAGPGDVVPGRRASDELIVRLDQKFADFVEVYTRDREDAQKWRASVEERLLTLTEALAEIQPNYKRILAAMGFVVTGCVTAVGVAVWNHVRGGH